MRAEIKAVAREAVAAQRGKWILLFFVLGLTGAVAAVLGAMLAVAVPGVGVLVFSAIYFVFIVMSVNIRSIAIRSFKKEEISIGAPYSDLGVNFFRKLGGMMWMSLWIFLWAMIPVAGYVLCIIKGFAYSMTPYILADCPNVTATEALKLSKRMTDGYKGELFVLAFSWIGWWLLSFLTFGILAFVHVMPYSFTTEAGFYIRLRDQAIASGKIMPSEFGLMGRPF